MEEKSILDLIVSGFYSDWFFNVFLTQFTLAVKNNLSILLLFAITWQRFSKRTENTWDDKASNWLVRKLTGKDTEEEKVSEDSKI